MSSKSTDERLCDIAAAGPELLDLANADGLRNDISLAAPRFQGSQ
jgi:hypothetical protein